MQSWVNLKSIDTSIVQTQQQVDDLDEHTAYLEKFYTPYLEGEYAPYFLGHENGTLWRGEYVVRMKHTVIDDDAILPEIEKKESILIATPQQSWDHFIKENLPFVYDRGLLTDAED